MFTLCFILKWTNRISLFPDEENRRVGHVWSVRTSLVLPGPVRARLFSLSAPTKAACSHHYGSFVSPVPCL